MKNFKIKGFFLIAISLLLLASSCKDDSIECLDLLCQIEQENNKLTNGLIDFQEAYKTTKGCIETAQYFDNLGFLVADGKASGDAVIEQAAVSLQATIQDVQFIQFPELRRNYSQLGGCIINSLDKESDWMSVGQLSEFGFDDNLNRLYDFVDMRFTRISYFWGGTAGSTDQDIAFIPDYICRNC